MNAETFCPTQAYKDGDRGKQGMARTGITNYFVNTIVTAFQAPEWDTLLQRLVDLSCGHGTANFI